MADSAAVAGLLWDRWIPASVRKLVAEVLPDGEGDARRLVMWLAGVHDIGKATPAFACQVDSLADRMRGAGLAMPYRREMGMDRRLAPHGLAGQLLLQDWLEGEHGWPGRGTAQFAVVVGGHHGAPPEHPQIYDLECHPELLRTPGVSEDLWRQTQAGLLDFCALEFGVADRLADWGKVKLPQPVQVLLSALVIVADWIASNSDLFPYFPDAASRADDERIAAAWRGLDLPEPWHPEVPRESAAELFPVRFDLPVGASLRPVQEAAVRIAREMPTPGLMVIEAPMGEGKTEAALAVAEVFAARAGAGGVFFALPTMATGNAMFPRLLGWLDRLPAEEGQRLSVQLVHSKAALNKDFEGLMRASRQTIAAIDMEGGGELLGPGDASRAAPAELVAHQWLRGPKKAMLASFTVGTIDQLLFAGLKSRHLALRHLALAGKVVVIDEAHAYDAYMNSYLDRVVSWLGAYRVPVVVLSATLPAARRRALAEAYAGAEAGTYGAVEEADGYPLLTAVAAGHLPLVESPGASGREHAVQVEALDDDLQVLAERLDTELADGGCVLVVRNTVNRVLETAKVLRTRFGIDAVTVAHARFIDLDRAAKDADLLDRFGPSSTQRPQRHIVVASQVAEQSLDVDFDLLVTDLAPVDLVLQRIGRLHRHGRDMRPARLREPRCLVTGVDWAASVTKPVRGSELVYGRHALLRSLAVLKPHLDHGAAPIRLPQDISPLVQTAYGEHPVGPPQWAGALDEARQGHDRQQMDKERRAETFRLGAWNKAGRPLTGWVAGGAGDADDTRAGRAQVRDSRESLEVIVVQRHADGSLTTVDWVADGRGGLPLPQDAVPSPRAGKAAAACGLRLPLQLTQPKVIGQVIAELEEFCVRAWQTKQSPWLAGELILPVQADCQTHLAGFVLSYSPIDGLEVRRDG
ncbi:CRISPR-associated helicase Cas3' [Streptomyces sp. CBMA152]|uniref:CRISPR-associated helicase Cas3' n=1 Tax=Streptomyces sp. CBMA152 TaxID=1896312 RepID=UPI0021D4103D|nr:CRISPR-associated helicase Cas3' [Streptomyces sp. CBMA152]MBD0741907.1 CRISPR-associated helicase/endonuclease Cas3 [Streptomyces sp. CBMA152]